MKHLAILILLSFTLAACGAQTPPVPVAQQTVSSGASAATSAPSPTAGQAATTPTSVPTDLPTAAPAMSAPTAQAAATPSAPPATATRAATTKPAATPTPAVVNTPKTPAPVPTCGTGKQLEPDQELSIDEIGGEGWSPDGRSILGRVYVTQEGIHPSTARVWDGTTGAQKYVLAHPDQVTRAAWSPDGRRIMTVDEQAAIRIWDAATGRQLQTWQEKSDVADADWSPDSQRLVTAAGKVARLWDTTTGKLLLELRGETSDMKQVVWSPDGRMIATASSELTARVWDAQTGSQIAQLPAPKGMDPASGGEIEPSIEWSRDSHRLLVSWPLGEENETTQVWDTMRHDTHTLAGVSVVSPAMSPDGRQILTRTSKDERVHLWNTDTGKETRSFPPHGTDVQPEWSPDGQHILVTSDAGVQIWNAATGQQVGSIRGEDLANSSIVVSPDGQHILVTSDAGVQIWDVATGKEVGSIRGEENPTAVWSPDARRIVTTSTTGLAHLYADPFTNGRLLEFPDYRSHCVDSNG